MTKVFGIGFQKTGTTTLGRMLNRLGYRTAGYHQFRDMAKKTDLEWSELRARALALASEYDAAKDTPWPLLYRELDEAFPGSKFIHVVRDRDSWIRSVVRDFGRSHNALHSVIYGVPHPEGHEDIWLARYDRHNADVEAYFSDRQDDYLKVRLEDGLSYTQICRFLGVPIVEEATPMANTRRRKELKSLWWRLKQKITQVFRAGRH
ncbi:sulfotransferase family protein [Jannaschia sp. W003]|uniref:sulfotransferase family protein n=1 Tax=Jannaschia sp. W003 TaxID=2867012 RepID=UPI0021A6C37B|nr:sulfotransferase family protein [Jannaschia sp. W003]UWQ23183.1 hypothetical protein K3554_16720 [Jannaschia sp. W003]